MTYKSLLTIVDGSATTLQSARTAAMLAARFDAHLTGVFPEPALPLSAWDEPVYWGMPPVTPPAIPPEILAGHKRRTDAEGERARLEFESEAGALGCRSDWLTMPADAGEGVLQLMRRTDLAVLPKGRLPTVGRAGSAVGDLILASGGPALVTPDAPLTAAPGRRAVVAWNGGREAARAVRDAWPFLTMAETVHVVVVGPAASDDPESRLQRYFEDHGCMARVIVVREPEAAVGSILLDQIRTLQADLLIMGLYGHSRFQEMVLGGVSQAMLRECPVSMLVSH